MYPVLQVTQTLFRDVMIIRTMRGIMAYPAMLPDSASMGRQFSG